MAEADRLNKTESVGKLVERLLQRSDTRGALRAARACAAWTDVAGPAAAAHSRAIRVTEGELVVAVDSPAWATEMSLMRGHYLAEMQARVGKDAVRSIRFTVSKHAIRRIGEADAGTAGETKDATQPREASDAEAEAVRAEVAERVSDAGLREAIVRARIAAREDRGGRPGRTAPEQR